MLNHRTTLVPHRTLVSATRMLASSKSSPNRSLWVLSGPTERQQVGPQSSLVFANGQVNGEDDDPVIRRQRTEAVLLLSKMPLSPRKLAQLAHLADATEARTLVRELNQIYDMHHRAVRIEQVAGGYRLLTRPSLAPWLARLGHLPPVMRLSSPMMETLAVVAYRQPVSRVNVEAVRGVACGELLRQLMERDLIRIAGRAEELGRPYLYGTTKRFLQLFGLHNTQALPPIEWQALQEDPPTTDPPQEELSTSTKESDVSIVAAPESETVDQQDLKLVAVDAVEPNAVIEDEEDDLYEGTGDFADDDDEDDDWDDEDDDWDEDDDELDEEEDDDFDDDDLEEDSWEEVDDEDADEFDDDDELDDEEIDDEEFDDEEDWDDDDEEEGEDWEDDEEEDD